MLRIPYSPSLAFFSQTLVDVAFQSLTLVIQTIGSTRMTQLFYFHAIGS